MLESDKDGPWTIQSLKQYFERMFSDRDKALTIAVTELDRRLEGLNNAHAQAKEKEREFYSRSQHDDFAKDINRQMDQLRNEMETARRPNWPIWFGAVTLLMSITGVLWYLAFQPIQTEMTHLRDRDNATVDQLKLTNDRIDRLYELYRDLQRQHFETFDGKPPPTSPNDSTKKPPR